MSTEAHSLVTIHLETQLEPQVLPFQCLEEPSYEEIFKDSRTQNHKSKNRGLKRIFRRELLGYIRWRNILQEGYIVFMKKGWKELVGHPYERGKCGIFFFFIFRTLFLSHFSFIFIFFLVIVFYFSNTLFVYLFNVAFVCIYCVYLYKIVCFVDFCVSF
jgi:hypothetical protein